jgi:hypothetical protein
MLCRMRQGNQWRHGKSGAQWPWVSPFYFMLLLLLLFLQAVAARAQPRPASSQRVVIVDTDAGSDDLMAIAFLLSRPDIRVET